MAVADGHTQSAWCSAYCKPQAQRIREATAADDRRVSAYLRRLIGGASAMSLGRSSDGENGTSGARSFFTTARPTGTPATTMPPLTASR